MPQPTAVGELSPATAWSQRVRKVGGYIQLAFAAFWLLRGALTIGGGAGTVLAGAALVLVAAVLVYAIRVTARTGRRPASPQARPIERSVTTATIIELAASFAFPSSSSLPATATGSCLPSPSRSGLCCSGSTISSTSPATVRSAGR